MKIEGSVPTRSVMGAQSYRGRRNRARSSTDQGTLRREASAVQILRIRESVPTSRLRGEALLAEGSGPCSRAVASACVRRSSAMSLNWSSAGLTPTSVNSRLHDLEVEAPDVLEHAADPSGGVVPALARGAGGVVAAEHGREHGRLAGEQRRAPGAIRGSAITRSTQVLKCCETPKL